METPGLSFFLHLVVIPFAYHASKLLANTTIKRELMNYKKSLAALAIAASALAHKPKLKFNGGTLWVALWGEWVNDQAKDFNASQKDYKIVPTFKGGYDESMTAAIAAFRSGNAPHILQVLRWAPPP
jgi:ABC-type glycerol-3-phosphate transport system substrate-binding protein